MTNEPSADHAGATNAPYRSETFEDALKAFGAPDTNPEPPQMPAAEPTSVTPPSADYRTDWAAIVAVLGALTMIVASFLSWGEVIVDLPEFQARQSFNAFDDGVPWPVTGANALHGWLFAVVGGLAIYAHWVQSQRLLSISVFGGLLCAGTAAYDYADIGRASTLAQEVQADVAALTGGTFGVNVTIVPVIAAIGSLMVGAGSVARMHRRR